MAGRKQEKVKAPELEQLAAECAKDERVPVKRDYLNALTLRALEAEALRARIDSLFAAIAHGDDAHRAWLKSAIDNHFGAKPSPKPPEPAPVKAAPKPAKPRRQPCGGKDCRETPQKHIHVALTCPLFGRIADRR